MAVRSGGPRPPRPPLPPKPAGAPRASARAKSPDAYAPTSGAAPSAPAERRGGLAGHRAILEQAVSSTTQQLAKLEQDAGRVLAVLAEQGYGIDAIERHRKQLARVRAMIEASRKRLQKSRRALHEIESGADQIPETELSRVQRELERLESCSTDWGRALEAVELAASAGASEPQRRLVVKGGDRKAALRHAVAVNPTTAIADLAAGATAEPASTAPLGRSLEGQRTLARAIARGRTKG